MLTHEYNFKQSAWWPVVMILEANQGDIDIGYTWIFSISNGDKSYKRQFQFTQWDWDCLYWNILHISTIKTRYRYRCCTTKKTNRIDKAQRRLLILKSLVTVVIPTGFSPEKFDIFMQMTILKFSRRLSVAWNPLTPGFVLSARLQLKDLPPAQRGSLISRLERSLAGDNTFTTHLTRRNKEGIKKRMTFNCLNIGDKN